MNALQKLWATLAERLPSDELAELQRQYRADNAADSRASRKRTKERQAADKARREARNKALREARETTNQEDE